MKMDRAYSLLELKAADEDQRILEGIASTPVADRMGDVIESEGAAFKLPLPLLWQHNSREPIGHVLEAKVSKKGIAIKAQIASGVSDKIDNAWKLIKAGLVRGLSIGFRPLEHEPLNAKDPWGPVCVKAWEWLELSAVTIAANQDASITAIKSLDRSLLAASGQAQHTVVRVNPAGVSASPKTSKSGRDSPMGSVTISERITAFEATRAAKAARMGDIMGENADKGETLNAEQAVEYDQLKDEIKAIDDHLVRLHDLEKYQIKSAKPVSSKQEDGSGSRDPYGTVQVRAVQQKLAPGIRLARYAKCLALAQKSSVSILDIAQQRYKDDEELIRTIKAVVVAGSTVSGSWAADLVGAETSGFADFVEYLRPQTIIGRFGNNGIPSLRRVPFRVPLISQTTTGQGYWVGQGKAKPLTSMDFSRIILEPLKVANIAALTEEVIRDSSPSAEAIVRDELVKALRERLDIDFIDPAKTAVAGISPASITNGATSVPSSGNDEDAIRADVRALMNDFITNNNPPTTGVWVMRATTALSLGMMANPLGQPTFPSVQMQGGTFFGMPIITSEHVGGDTAGDIVALINAADIYMADEGGFEVAISREASLEMNDAPTGSSVATVTATSLVSMFQTNSVAFRAERTINWARRRPDSVAYLSGVNWGAAP